MLPVNISLFYFYTRIAGRDYKISRKKEPMKNPSAYIIDYRFYM